MATEEPTVERGLTCHEERQSSNGYSASPASRSSRSRPDNAVWIAGGTFSMGSERFYREERPVRTVAVDGFWIDRYPVTNAAFAGFIAATDYITLAERAPDPTLYPDADPALLVPGSLVFCKPCGPVSLQDFRAWWAYVPGASWRQPQGPGSGLEAKTEHPVVHIAYQDACTYAAWAGKSLPTEAEWEFAARGGLDGAVYAWGDEFAPDGRRMANTWLGRFPWQHSEEDRFQGTSPVNAFPANGYGLHDMIGNVWEWTESPYLRTHELGPIKSCCVPNGPSPHLLRQVVKGGSHLCAPNHCLRYRPSARQGEAVDTSTSHIGFRCITRPTR